MRHYVPDMALLQRAFSAGEWPLWDPFVFLGVPFGALTQSGVFYPPTLLSAVLAPDPPTAFALWVALHLVVGGCGVLLWTRHLTGSVGISVLGALGFQWAGVTLSLISLKPAFSSMCWTPWVCWAVERYRSDGRGRWLAATACFLAMLILHSSPIAAGACLAFISITWRWGREPWLHWRPLGACVLTALLMCGCTLLPMAQAVAESSRAYGETVANILHFSIRPSFHASWILPPAFPRFDSPFWSASFPDAAEPFITSLYIGPVAACLVVVAFVLGYKTSRWVKMLFWGSLFCCVLAVGRHLPGMTSLVEWLRPLIPVRYPPKLLLFPALTCIALVPRGLYLLDASRRETEGMDVLAKALQYAVIIGAIGLLYALAVPRMLDRSLRGALAVDPSILQGPWNLWSHFFVVAGLAGLTFLLGRRHGPSRRYLPLLLGLLMVADLVTVNHHLVATTESVFYEPGPVVHRIKSSGSEAAVVGAFDDTYTLLSGEGGALAYDLENRTRLIQRYPTLFELRTGNPEYPLEPKSSIRLLEVLRSSTLRDQLTLYGALGFSHVLYEDDVRNEAIQRVGRSGNVRIYSLNQVTPRCFLAEEVLESQAPLETWKTTLLERGRPEKLAVLRSGEVSPPPSPSGSPGLCRLTHLGYDRVEAELRVTSPTVFVLLDLAYPGWVARVNGAPRPLLTVNGTCRGVSVAPGDQTVVLTYEPGALALGGLLSLVGLLSCLSLAWQRPSSVA